MRQRTWVILSLLIFCQIAFSQKSLNKIFLSSKGKWNYPVVDFKSFKSNNNPSAEFPPNKGVTFNCDSSYLVFAVFKGEVILVTAYDSLYLVITKYGDYFIGYASLCNTIVKYGDMLKAGDPIGKMGFDLGGKYSLEMMLSSKKEDDIELYPWFKSAPQ